MDKPTTSPQEAMYKNLQHDNVAHAVADASNDGILLIDVNHNIVYISNKLKHWFHLMDIDSNTYINQKDSIFYSDIALHLNNPEMIQNLFDSVKGKANLISEALNLEFKADIYKYLNVFTAPIYQSDDGYLGRIWVFDNRTKEHEIDQAKTEFISIASHQLRTPLTAIRGYLSMLDDGDAGILEPQTKEYVSAALEGANRLVELVEDLLNISRLDMGKTVIEKKDIDIKKAISEIINTCKTESDEKSQNLLIDIQIDDSTTFQCDSKLLTHTVSNILDNAIKYTPKGGKIIIKSWIINGKVRKELFVEIKDSGIGIPKSQQKNVFQKFFRADNVRNNDFKGTGIGLYYVKKLIGEMGGSVTFESAKDKGTTFKIKIPE